MKRLLTAFLFTMATTINSVAQEVTKDSIQIPQYPNSLPTGEVQGGAFHGAPAVTDFHTPLPDITKDQHPVADAAYDVSKVIGRPYLFRWDTGNVVGYNGMYSEMYGYGYQAGAVLTQQWDRWTLKANLDLTKTMTDGIGVTNGIGGDMQLEYRLGRNTAVTAIGGMNYYGWMGPAPNTSTAYYGGYFTLNTNNGKWAVDLGVRQEYNSMTGQWSTVPIIMPYYNLGGAKLGIDFGGLLYSTFNSAKEARVPDPGDRHYRGPAVIAPPIDMKPKKLSTEVPASMGNSCLK